MANKISLQFTKAQLQHLVSLIDTVESMIGGSDDLGDGAHDWDTEVKKNIKSLDKALWSNGYSRDFSNKS